MSAADMRSYRERGGGDFYLAALRCAQSLWQMGKPAQSILMLNKAWSVDITGNEQILIKWRPPYMALRWILENAPPDAFLGNPVRHFQHLASRMSGPRSEVRAWRAWACMHLGEAVLPSTLFARDVVQVEKEGLIIPDLKECLRKIQTLGWADESDDLKGALSANSQ